MVLDYSTCAAKKHDVLAALSRVARGSCNVGAQQYQRRNSGVAKCRRAALMLHTTTCPQDARYIATVESLRPKHRSMLCSTQVLLGYESCDASSVTLGGRGC